LPIDPDFQKNREKVGKEEGVANWGPIDPPEKLGIRGTYRQRIRLHTMLSMR